MSSPDNSHDPLDPVRPDPDDPNLADWDDAVDIPRLERVTVAVRHRDPRLWGDTPVPVSVQATKPSYTARLAAYLRARTNLWTPATDLFRFGQLGWRTRLSEARRGQYRDGAPTRIDNRQRRLASGAVISEYRYRP